MKKRIVTCPECEVKLSIFDFGKPIDQKCPKCNKTFVIESEEKDEKGKADEKKADAAKSAGDDEKKADDAKTAGEIVKTTEDEGKEDKKGDKESKDKPVDKSNAQKSEKKDAPEKKSEDVSPDKASDKDKPSDKDKASDKKASATKDKEITPKKSVASAGGIDKPTTTSSDLDDMELHAPAGPSPLFPMIVFGGLILLLVMQIMMKTRMDKQYKTLIEHLQYIEKTLAAGTGK